MKQFAPQKIDYYPLYIFFSWLAIWALVVTLSLIGIYMKTTPDGQFVEKFYKIRYYVPLGEEIKNMIVKTGIISGIITILVGYSYMILHLPHKKHSKRH